MDVDDQFDGTGATWGAEGGMVSAQESWQGKNVPPDAAQWPVGYMWVKLYDDLDVHKETNRIEITE